MPLRTRRATSAPPNQHSTRRPALRAVVALGALAALAVTPLATARVDASPRVEIVVGFDGAAPPRLESAALDAAGVRVEERLPGVDAALVSVPAADAEAALAELRAAGAVDYAAREGVRRPALVPNDPLYAASTWPFVDAALPSAWDLTTGDDVVVVAVLDSGVDGSHPDLPPLAAGYDFVNEDADPTDDLGHGTAVAGALGARMGNSIGSVGACPACTLMPVKVLDGSGLAADADIAEGIVWATDHGADVINLSLGGPTASHLLDDAVAYATSRDVVVVAAAGNDGTSVPNYPAAIENVLGVAAMDQYKHIAPYSNHGPHFDLAAPECVQTTSRGGGYAVACGTSIAAPLVAGIAGLVRARHPALNRAQVAGMLTGAANGGLGLDVANGLVDAHRALVLADATGSPPVSTAAPAIAGTIAAGEKLTATAGSWSGSPNAFAYAWERCNASGGACGAIGGADALSYRLTFADVGSRLRVVVTATAGGASTKAASAQTGVVSGEPTAAGAKVDLVASLEASDPTVAVGSTIAYTARVAARPLSRAADAVTLTVTLPTGLAVDGSSSSQGTCASVGQVVTCDLGHLASTAEAEVEVTAVARSAGRLSVLATAVSAPEDAKPGDNRATTTVTVSGADIAPGGPSVPASGPTVSLKSGVTIAGAAKVGRRLVARPDGGLTGIRYQWQSCRTVNGAPQCANLRGKTASSLVLSRSLVGRRVRVRMNGTAADGTHAVRASRVTAPVRR